jgi:DNA-directed RNA polymerase subunit RPC12/RpoP
MMTETARPSITRPPRLTPSESNVLTRPTSSPAAQAALWTDARPNGGAETNVCRGNVPLPIGAIGSQCTNCGRRSLVGALITATADAKDPNILCLYCGYWRD